MEKKGFHILTEREDEGMRHPHPQFKFYNNPEKWDKRQTLYGMLVHKTEEELFEWHLKAPVIRKPMHPHKRPHCIGDGVRAIRWSFGEPDDFLEITCPNERCEFRQGDKPKCTPWMRFLFLVVWPYQQEVTPPSVLCKFTSRSWNTVTNFVGFFNYISKTAKGMHLPDYSLMGFPFSISHTYQTQPEKGRRYQVVKITQGIEPSEFFFNQMQRLKALTATRYEAITDESQQRPDVVFEDIKHVSWGDPTD